MLDTLIVPDPKRWLFILLMLLPGSVAAMPTDNGVRLSTQQLQAQGILLAPLEPATQTPAIEGIASVRDPAPLLATAADLASARAQAHAAAATAAAARSQSARLAALGPHGYVAQNEVQTSAAQATAAEAQHAAAMAQLGALQAAARARWGEALALLAARGTSALADYAQGRATLVELALPPGTEAPPAARIMLQPASGEPLPGRLLDPSPQADLVVQGPTYFYRVAGGSLRAGQRITAHMPLPQPAHAGVRVPADAVLWYAGQPWVYAETAPGHFERVPLPADSRDAQGWFVSGGLRKGQRVVVRGAELLLSQELKPPPGARAATGDDDDDD